jgi:hypothetical protein
MEATYVGIHMWKQAVEKAKSTDTDKVIAAMAGQTFKAPSGFTLKMDEKNHHLHKPVLIGEIKADGQFNVVWKTKGPIKASPGAPTSKATTRRRTSREEVSGRRRGACLVCTPADMCSFPRPVLCDRPLNQTGKSFYVVQNFAHDPARCGSRCGLRRAVAGPGPGPDGRAGAGHGRRRQRLARGRHGRCRGPWRWPATADFLACRTDDVQVAAGRAFIVRAGQGVDPSPASPCPCPKAEDVGNNNRMRRDRQALAALNLLVGDEATRLDAARHAQRRHPDRLPLLDKAWPRSAARPSRPSWSWPARPPSWAATTPPSAQGCGPAGAACHPGHAPAAERAAGPGNR